MIKLILYKNIFIVPIICGIIVQLIKMGIYSIVGRELDIGKLFQTDGMPNLHATVFGSLSAIVGLKYGYSSILFAVSATYTVIILHDTMRVKREKEKQVGILRSIIFSVHGYSEIDSFKTSRILQFRPLDVISGAALGVLLTYIVL
ncbi:MAG: divergent PAP2 family protein [Candidatus Krumholzibacteriota bacterium]|nr:divergent PAP2 family protein [Candidatus Krumholzibacteriota bacterium]